MDKKAIAIPKSIDCVLILITIEISIAINPPPVKNIPLLLMIPQVCYIKKYYGYIFLDDNHLILQKGKKQIVMEISDIRWIELWYDHRSGTHGALGPVKKFRFSIRLNNQKEDLDFIITNQIILDIIKKHNIRIMPDQYNQIYINTGKFDFR